MKALPNDSLGPIEYWKSRKFSEKFIILVLGFILGTITMDIASMPVLTMSIQRLLASGVPAEAVKPMLFPMYGSAMLFSYIGSMCMAFSVYFSLHMIMLNIKENRSTH